ncbi:MAG: hypothetical protein ACR2O3_12400 [Rhizobiaceae bacterium]
MRLVSIFLVLILVGCVSQPPAYNVPVRGAGNIETRVDGVKVSVGVSRPYITSIIYRPKSAQPELDFETANRAAEQVVGCRGVPNVEQYHQFNTDPQPPTIVQVTVSC